MKRIFDSKTFDNGTICASEQSVVTERCIEAAVVQELERQGFRVQLRVLLPGGLRVPISRTYRSTAREQFFSRLQI